MHFLSINNTFIHYSDVFFEVRSRVHCGFWGLIWDALWFPHVTVLPPSLAMTSLVRNYAQTTTSEVQIGPTIAFRYVIYDTDPSATTAEFSWQFTASHSKIRGLCSRTTLHPCSPNRWHYVFLVSLVSEYRMYAKLWRQNLAYRLYTFSTTFNLRICVIVIRLPWTICL